VATIFWGTAGAWVKSSLRRGRTTDYNRAGEGGRECKRESDTRLVPGYAMVEELRNRVAEYACQRVMRKLGRG